LSSDAVYNILSYNRSLSHSIYSGFRREVFLGVALHLDTISTSKDIRKVVRSKVIVYSEISINEFHV
jgi:hypothetical protein